MKRRYPVLLVLAVAAVVVAGCLSGCSLRGGVRFIDCTNARAIARDGEEPPAPAEFEITQLNTVCGIEIRSVRAEAGGSSVMIRPKGTYSHVNITPVEGGLMLSVEGLSGGTAEIETMDQAATLPVVVYNHYLYGGWHGIIVSAENTKQLTEVRDEAHFWDEWRAEANGNQWKALVPAYIADPGTDTMGANQERLAAIKTVDVERFADAPAEQWLETNRIYVCKVPDGYVKIANTSRGVIWLFSPTPEFP